MKSRAIVLSVCCLVVVVGIAYILLMQNNDAKPSENTASSTVQTTDQVPKAAETSDIDSLDSEQQRYIELDAYKQNPSVYDSTKKVYFFHAPWCPICKTIDSAIKSDPSQVPSGTTIIKTDFDSNDELRQKYGVTYQYTFVQIDNNGNEIKQWSATSLDKALAGIE